MLSYLITGGGCFHAAYSSNQTKQRSLLTGGGCFHAAYSSESTKLRPTCSIDLLTLNRYMRTVMGESVTGSAD